MGMRGSNLKQKEMRAGIHPAWRGIGCLLMILVPIISFAAADVYIESNLDKIAIPFSLRMNLDTIVLGVVRFFPAKLLLAVIVTFALFAMIFILYSVMYSVIGGNKRGPMDVAPSRKKIKKRDR